MIASETVVIDEHLRFETSKSMPPKTPPLIESTLQKTYTDLCDRLIDSKENVTHLPLHEIASLAHDLNVGSTQLLNLVQGDWRLVLIAATPIKPETESSLRLVSEVWSLTIFTRNILESSVLDPSCMIQKSLWDSVLTNDQQFSEVAWKFMSKNDQISLAQGKN